MSETAPTAEATDTTEVVAEPETVSMTQAEIDALIADRIGRERKKYADYNDLKAAAAKLAEIEESQKTELQKATETAAQYQERLEALNSKLRTQAVTSAITQAALAAGAVNPAQVVKLLDLEVEVDDDYNIVTDVEAAVTAFLTENPHLTAKAPTGAPQAVPGNSKPAAASSVVNLSDIASMDPAELAKNPELWKSAIEARNQYR